MDPRFKIKRMDGRSNQQVIIDLCKDKPAGHVLTFDALKAALDTPGSAFTRQRIGGCVRAANVRLLKEEKRELTSVRDVGYKIAAAHEHTMLAAVRERSADRQIRRGLQTLRNVRLEEMSEAQRQFHIGHLAITAGIYTNMRALASRQKETDDLVRSLVRKVDALQV